MGARAKNGRLGLPKTLAFSLAPVLLLLIAAELALRVTGAAWRCPSGDLFFVWVCDPILYFRPSPNLVVGGQRLNSLGFRDTEFTAKRQGVLRILTLGDSCTFGLITPSPGIDDFVAEPYPQRLERLVAERHGAGRIEVLNAGVSGYNSFQGVMLLRTKLRGMAPDLVTVRYGWNDLLASPGQNPESAFREPATAAGRFVEDLLLRTALYPFGRRLALEVRAHSPGNRALVPQEPPTEWRPNVRPNDYKHNLRRIAELARGAGARVWFLSSPDAFTTDDYRGRYREFGESAQHQLAMIRWGGIESFEELAAIHASYNHATREVGAELGVPVVDMEDAYRGHASTHLFSPVDAIHPNQEGHDLEAETLYARLRADGIIGSETKVSHE